MHARAFGPLAAAGFLVAIDQLSKAWVAANVPLGVREHSLGLGFHITHTRNTGAAFGLLRDLQLPLGPLLIDATVLLGLLNLAVSALLVAVLLRRGPRLGSVTRWAVVLVLAGAAGNMVDRLLFGFVVDFIDFQAGAFDFAVFNVADACIVVGAALLVLGGLLGDKPSTKQPHEAPPPDQVGR